MKLCNCTLIEAQERFAGKKIVFFGCGSWLKMVEYTELEALRDQFAYIIDNSYDKSVLLSGKELQVYSPNKLKSERECIVILCSPVYQYEMYCQLCDMEIDESIICYSFPFMQEITDNRFDRELYERISSSDRIRIPKIIHGFWFSGDEKTDLYKNCMETWYKLLPDYEIIEWNMNNYDWHKHPFLERAIELEAWAFASDYARLDVLNSFGGIYLDMDVDVVKPFDDFLGNKMILSFANHVLIDLAVIAAEKDNDLIKRMLKVYDDLDLPDTKQGFSSYFQPALLRGVLADYGIKMDGSLQLLNDGTAVFPKDFFMPLDYIMFREREKSENTYCIHYDNFGWSYSGGSKREKKIKDNTRLWNCIVNNVEITNRSGE